MTQQEVIKFMARNNPEGVKTMLVSTGWPSFAATPANAESNLLAYFAGGGDLRIFNSVEYLNGTPNETGGIFNKSAQQKLLGDVNFGQILGGILSGVGGVLTGQNQNAGGGIPLNVAPDPTTAKTINTIQFAFIAFGVLVVAILLFMAFKGKK